MAADNVLSALENCVIYRINGPYRAYSTGLACYYSYNSDPAEYEQYAEMQVSEPFIHLYGYAIKGELSREGQQYASALDLADGVYDPQPVQTLLTIELEDYPVTVDDEGNAMLTLGPRIADMLTGVYFELSYVSEEDDFIMLLGRDNDIDADWEAGIFRDNFRGVWPALDGYFVYLELTYEGDDYTLYDVPILLNSEEYYLTVGYDYSIQEYIILGAHRGLGGNGQADQIRPLLNGDQITILHYAATLYGDDDFIAVPLETITWNGSNTFQEEDLGDATFVLYFEMVDAQNNSVYSDYIWVETEGDYIYMMELEEE